MSIVAVLASLIVGSALGTFFFGGLWWTVRRLASTAHPLLMSLGSFWLRMAVVLIGFLLLAKRNAGYAVLAAAGFLAGRFIVTRFFAHVPLSPHRRPEVKCT